MTQSNEESYRGFPPPPVVELTMEQQFKLRQLEDLLDVADRKDIITIFLALQRQNYCLSNTVTNLVKKWPNNPLLTTPEEQ